MKNKSNLRNLYFNASNSVQSAIYSKIFKIQSYFKLKHENEEIFNAYVKNLQHKYNVENFLCTSDTSVDSVYIFIPSRVIQITANMQNNYFTLDKGQTFDVYPEAGVVSANGIIGIVTNVSKNYCVGLTLNNTINGFSARIKNYNFFGSITWDAKDYRYVILNEIPNHIKIKIGDTVITTGYDAVFPPDYPVGTIDTFYKNSQDNFYTIRVKLFEDLRNVQYAIIVLNKKRNEILNLQNELKNFVE